MQNIRNANSDSSYQFGWPQFSDGPSFPDGTSFPRLYRVGCLSFVLVGRVELGSPSLYRVKKVRRDVGELLGALVL